MPRRFFLGLLALLLVAATVVSPVDAGWPYANLGKQTNFIHETTRVKNLDPFFFQSSFFPAFGDDFKATTIVERYPFDPQLLGMKRAKGTAETNYSCVSTQTGADRSLGRDKAKFDEFGNAVMTKEISGSRNCDFTRGLTSFKGGQKQAAGSSVRVLNALQRLPPGVDDDCFDEDTLCLHDGRFKVNLEWRDFEGSGLGFPIATGYDEGLFFFFNDENVASTIKVLDACNVPGFDHFWVFFGALTNVEFTLTVTDTVAGVSRVYDNPLGRPAPAVTDTAAFATCP